MRRATLRVNPIMCEAHGLCAELLPELIRLDDWGYPIIDESEVPPDLIGPGGARRRRVPDLGAAARRELVPSMVASAGCQLWPAPGLVPGSYV